MSASRVRTVRDPVWGNVPLDPVAAAIVDTPAFQRLRRVKQLGFAHLAYPGAVHTRFLHALGVYHLTGRALEALERAGALAALAAEERALLPVVRLAALLHDVGHYAFSHAMEELEPEAIPGDHEEVAARFLDAPPIRAALEATHPDAPRHVSELIRGRSPHPLQGLVSGSLDLDKIDYLRRDGFFCGVPYGAVDVDRLLDSLTLARGAPGGPLEVAVTAKGVSALESLLFSKYQMFRNVYWHHTVRAATAAFRRLVESALACGALAREELPGRTDEELMGLLARRLEERSAPPIVPALLRALVDRKLPKRVIELFADDLPEGGGSWVRARPDLVRALEERLALEWGAAPGTVLVDYPSNPRMLELHLLLVRRRGEVRRLTSTGEEGLIDLPRLGRSLLHTTRVFRVFTLEPSAPRDPGPVRRLLGEPEEEVGARLGSGSPLYG